MNAATIQQKVWLGYAKAASYVGYSFAHYRPISGQPLIGAATSLGSINASFAVAGTGFNYEKAGLNKGYYWYALADGNLLSPGDIMVSATQTFAIAAMQPLLPIVAILSNDRISVTRPVSELSTSGGLGTAPVSQTGGAVPYFGVRNTEVGGETAIISGVPCAIAALGARALASKDGEPSSAPGPVRWKFIIAAGVIPQGTIRDRDVVTDQLGSRYQVSQNYWGPLGYEVEAVRLEA